MRRDDSRRPVEKTVQIGALARLHETEMTLGMGQGRVARHRPRQGISGACSANASRKSAACEAAPTRLNTIPAIGGAPAARAKPATNGPAEAPSPRASTTSTTGQPAKFASSAVEPTPSAPTPS
jgi:hypothetical protein